MLRRILFVFLLLLAAPAARAEYSGPGTTGGSGGITVGSPITGTCPNGDVVYSNNGLIGCEVVAGTGTVTSVGWTGGIVSIANPTTVPAFTIAGTSGGIPYFASSSTWASSAALAANAIVIGGGAGSAPSTTTTGANVLTALGAAINASTGLPNVDGAITTGDCLKWGPGIQDAGSACGSGGSGTLTVGTTATSGGAAGQLMYDTGSVLTESANLTFTTGLLINGATLPTNAAFALDYSPGANTLTPGLAIINANVASSGNQQESCVSLVGQAWNTTGPSSQAIIDQLCNVPVQGTSALNQAGFKQTFQVNAGTVTTLWDYDITNAQQITLGSGIVFTGQAAGNSKWQLTSSPAGFALVSNAFMSWQSSSTSLNGSNQTIISEPSAGVVSFDTTSAGNALGTVKGGNLIETAAASTVAASQIGYGGTVAAASNCNVTSPTPTGCVVINVAGTTRYLPYY